MEQRYQAFLLVAETLSMSRAAEICFVSPQCISGHIRGLEQQYGVQLFLRHPKLSITAEGEALAEMLRKMKDIESGLGKLLQNVSQQITGKLSIGIPISRYAELMPKIAIPLKEKYPAVDIEVLDMHSSEAEYRVSDGLLDVAITTKKTRSIELSYVPLLNDLYVFIVSRKLMEEIYETKAEKMAAEFLNGITLEDIAKFPLVLNSAVTSRMRRWLDQYASDHHIKFRVIFESNRFDIFDCLARNYPVAGIIPHMMLSTTVRNNSTSNYDQFLYSFPINFESLGFKNTISYVVHKKSPQTPYKNDLIDIIQRQFEVYRNAQSLYFGDQSANIQI